MQSESWDDYADPAFWSWDLKFILFLTVNQKKATVWKTVALDTEKFNPVPRNVSKRQNP